MALLFIETNQTKSCPAKDLILPLEILLNLTDTSCSFIYVESKRTRRHRMCFKTLRLTMSFFFKEEKNSQQLLIKICMARYRRGFVFVEFNSYRANL